MGIKSQSKTKTGKLQLSVVEKKGAGQLGHEAGLPGGNPVLRSENWGALLGGLRQAANV
jgi:hypothetical protein